MTPKNIFQAFLLISGWVVALGAYLFETQGAVMGAVLFFGLWILYLLAKIEKVEAELTEARINNESLHNNFLKYHIAYKN